MRGQNNKIIIAVFTLLMSSFWPQKVLARKADDQVKELELKEYGPAKEGSPDLGLTSQAQYSAEGLRDPFKSYIVSGGLSSQAQQISGEQALPFLEVQGIIWGGSFPQAIINNKVVKIGDTLEGVRIIDINKQGVTVFFGSRQHNLASPGMAGPKPKSQGGQDENHKTPIQSPYLVGQPGSPLF